MGTQSCWTIQLWEHRAVGLYSYGNIELLDYNRYGNIEMLDYTAMGTQSCCQDYTAERTQIYGNMQIWKQRAVGL